MIEQFLYSMSWKQPSHSMVQFGKMTECFFGKIIMASLQAVYKEQRANQSAHYIQVVVILEL